MFASAKSAAVLHWPAAAAAGNSAAGLANHLQGRCLFVGEALQTYLIKQFTNKQGLQHIITAPGESHAYIQNTIPVCLRLDCRAGIP